MISATQGLVRAFPPTTFDGFGLTAFAAAAQVALILNSEPTALSLILKAAADHPLWATILLLFVSVSAVGLGWGPQRGAVLIKRSTIVLIAGCLSLLALELLNVLDLRALSWVAVITGMTTLILVGGLASLISDLRFVSRRYRS